MGACSAVPEIRSSTQPTTSNYTPSKTTWVPLLDVNVVRSKYISSDESLRSNCSALQVEFRALLDHPFFFSAIEQKHKEYPLILMWKAILCHSNKLAQSDGKLHALAVELRRSMQSENGKKDVDHYIAEIDAIDQTVELKAKLHMRLRIISGLRRVCFSELFDGFFLQYRHTPEYRSICSQMVEIFNKVEPDDFEYVSKLGSGGFGMVLHCRKKSTGRAYAMKIQSKAHLLMHHRSRPKDVMVEMRALSAFNHPYLARVDYAFQSSTLVFLAMPLMTCGDLEKSLNMSFYGWFSARRVQFYAAEIISALCYMHQRRIIFRDLKPSNVLLQADGHIQLADFGSVCDLESRLDMYSEAESSAVCSLGGEPLPESSNSRAPIFGNCNAYSLEFSHRSESQPFNNSSCVASRSVSSLLPGSQTTATTDEPVPLAEMRSESGKDKVKASPLARRPMSLIGTMSYMAPEIIRLYAKSPKQKNVDKTAGVVKMVPSGSVAASNDNVAVCGEMKVDPDLDPDEGLLEGNLYYSYSVDWWSLGALLFKLSTGKSPCRSNITYAQLHRQMPDIYRACDGDMEKCINKLYKTENFLNPLDCLDADLKDLIVNFMTIDPEKRLGGVPLDSSLRHMMAQQEAVKHASFFNDVDWDAIDSKQVPPPYIPKGETLDSVQYALPLASSPARAELIQHSIQKSNVCVPRCCCPKKAPPTEVPSPPEPRTLMSSAVFEMTAAQAAAVAEARATQYPPLTLREILKRLKKLHWITPLEPDPVEHPRKAIRNAKISPGLSDAAALSRVNKENSDEEAAAAIGVGVQVGRLEDEVVDKDANSGEHEAEANESGGHLEVRDSVADMSVFEEFGRYQVRYSVAQQAQRQAEELKEVCRLHKKYQVSDDQQVHFEDWKFTAPALIEEESFLQQHISGSDRKWSMLSKLSPFRKVTSSSKSTTLSVSWNSVSESISFPPRDPASP